MKRTYTNRQIDVTIRFVGQNFVIMGDESKVDDDTLMSLFEGNVVSGWEEIASW